MNPILSISKVIPKLLFLVIIWNTCSVVSNATPVNIRLEPETFQTLHSGINRSFFVSQDQEDPENLKIFIEEFVTEEKDPSEKDLHLDAGLVCEQFSLPPPSEVGSFNLAGFHISSFNARPLYIWYSSLKIPFPIS